MKDPHSSCMNCDENYSRIELPFTKTIHKKDYEEKRNLGNGISSVNNMNQLLESTSISTFAFFQY